MAESMAKSGALLYKAEGNAAFQGGEYEKALQSYSDGIAALHAYTPAEDSIGGGAAAEPELLTVLFSNRAESLLRLARHEEALAAAEEALTITPCHKKSLSRKAKAAAAIQQRTATQSGTAGKLEGESAAPAAGAAGAAANPQNGTRSAALEARAGRVERLQQATQAPEPEPEPAAAPPSSVGPGPSAGAVATGRRPVCAIVVGMAGSGKTTLMQRLNAHLYQKATPGYVINLDPAVQHTPYEANIDIRDTVDFKQVMKEYKLGPNGGIMTALNLFATRFDKVVRGL
jgi:tetratricopeptide (TPR) repeat protein